MAKYREGASVGRLLIVAPSAFPLGGVANWLDYLVPGLSLLGWDIVVGLTSGQHNDVAAYLEQHPFPKVVSISCGSGTQEGRLAGLSTAIRSVDPDIIAFTNLPDVCIAAGRLHARERIGNLARARVVLVNHGIQHDLFADMRSLRLGLDAIVCTNRLATALATEFGGIAAARSFYCPCGTSVPAYRPALKLRAGQPLRVGYFGRYEQEQKRVFDLPKIAAELDRRGFVYEFVLAGGGPDEMALQAAFADATRSPVTFLGAVPAAEVGPRVLDRIDVMILTSDWETGPLVIWEGMAAGVPVVTSRYVGSGREGSLIHGHNCLMFPIGDVGAAADLLVELADPQKADVIAAHAFGLVKQHYSLKASVAGWDSALRAISHLPMRTKDDWNAVVAGLSMPPAGRLDILLGRYSAELVRVALGRRFAHSGPGGEWPHTLNAVDPRCPTFWGLAAALDRSAA